MQPSSSKPITVEMPGRDRITAQNTAQGWTVEVIGCREVTELVTSLELAHGQDPAKWPEPSGNTHSALLVRELILRARGEWKYPYEHLELCHCRSVLTDTVDQAILAGAHTCEKVSRRTSASTACGTCRPDVQKILDYRLKTGV